MPTSASSISFLEPAGLENAVGLISSSAKRTRSTRNGPTIAGVKEYFAFMKQHMPNADLNNSNYAAGYHYATLMVKVLQACKDDFSRENILQQAASLRDVQLPLLLPGITVSTGPTIICRSSNCGCAVSTARAGSALAKSWTTARTDD